MSEAEAHALAKRDLTGLLCLPGLSRREEAGALSGRGVGMDAVHEAITALGGRLQINTRSGRGTLITVRLPST